MVQCKGRDSCGLQVWPGAGRFPCRLSQSLDRSLDGSHANPCLLANELRAGVGGSGPRLTLPAPPTAANPSESFPPVQPSQPRPGGPVCGPPSWSSCCGAYTSNSQTPVPCAAVVSAVPTPTLRSHCQQRLLSSARHSAWRPPSSPQTSLQAHHCLARLSCHVCHRGARLDPRWPG